jgi:hypothetical protein
VFTGYELIVLDISISQYGRYVIHVVFSTTKTFVRKSFTGAIARSLASSLARHFPHSPSRVVDPAPRSLVVLQNPTA